MSEDGETFVVDRSASYEGGGNPTADAALRMNKRLGIDYRNKIRDIAVTPPFTAMWEYQVDSLQYMASVALMEERDSKAKKVAALNVNLAAAGGGGGGPGASIVSLVTDASQNIGEMKSGKEDGTLWEREEFAARYIVEEGKLNLIMRVCAEYKEYVVKAQSTGDIEKLTPQDVARGKSYETSLGVLLRISMVAVEAVQTLDVRNMIEHVHFCWTYALANDNSDTGTKGYTPPFTIAAARRASGSSVADEREQQGGNTPSKPSQVISNVDFLVLQEGVSIQYIMYLLQHAEELQENVIMEKMAELDMWRKLLDVVEKFVGLVSNLSTQEGGAPLSTFAGTQVTDYLTSICGCYAALFTSDTYKARMNEFWPGGKADKQRWSALIQPIVKGVIGTDSEKKKLFRPVTDAILRFS